MKININAEDVLVVDYRQISTLENTDLSSVLEGKTKLLIQVREQYLDAMDKDQFLAVEAEFLAVENWTALKYLNEIKIQLNYLFRKKVVDCYPNFMQLELTDYCNAECIMCNHLYQKNHGAQHLSKESFAMVESILPYLRVAILHGNGEPFLNPNLDYFLEQYCKYDISVSTATNLSVFNEKIASYINRCFADIRVSCDGCTKEIYEKIRRNLKFERLENNLMMLKELCPNVKKVLLVVIMQQNIHQLKDFIPFAKKYGFSEVIFINMTTSVALENESDSPLYYKEEVKYQIEIAKTIADELGVRIVYPDMYDSIIEKSPRYVEPVFRSDREIDEQIDRISAKYHINRAPIEKLEECNWQEKRIPCRGICDWCVEKTYIDLQGNVYICCINNSYTLGSVNDAGFEPVWNGKEMQKIRESFYGGAFPDFCAGCHFVLNHSLEHVFAAGEDEELRKKKIISGIYKREITD